ncbi:MAG: hypothetical protein FWH36_00745 [Lentimicrobiaceae bacterium]|nr:hypothetical protein [Lentimicrobiaceae bacterium]
MKRNIIDELMNVRPPNHESEEDSLTPENIIWLFFIYLVLSIITVIIIF